MTKDRDDRNAAVAPPGSTLKEYADSLGLSWEELRDMLCETFPNVFDRAAMEPSTIPGRWFVSHLLFKARAALARM